MSSKFFFKPFVTILVAPVNAGIVIHFTFHIRYIFIYKPLYLISFPLPLHDISLHWYCNIYQYAWFPFLLFLLLYLAHFP